MVFDPGPHGSVARARRRPRRPRPRAAVRRAALPPAPLGAGHGRPDLAGVGGGPGLRHRRARPPGRAAGSRRRGGAHGLGVRLLVAPARPRPPAVGDGPAGGPAGRSLGSRERRPTTAMVDGVGSVDVGHVLLDAERAPRKRPTSARPATGSDAAPRTGHGPRLWALPGAVAHTAWAGLQAVLDPASLREALRRSHALADLSPATSSSPRPRASLNRPIGKARRFAVVRAPLEGPEARQARARGHHQRRRARGRHRWPARAPAAPRRGAAGGRRARDGAREHPGRGRAARAGRPDHVALRAPPGRRGDAAGALRQDARGGPPRSSAATRPSGARRLLQLDDRRAARVARDARAVAVRHPAVQRDRDERPRPAGDALRLRRPDARGLRAGPAGRRPRRRHRHPQLRRGRRPSA